MTHWKQTARTPTFVEWTHESGAELRLYNVSGPPNAERRLELNGDVVDSWTVGGGKADRDEDARELFETGMSADELSAELKKANSTGLGDFA